MSQFRRRPQPPEIVEAEQVREVDAFLWRVTLADGSRRIYEDEKFHELYERMGIVALVSTDLEGEAR